LEGNRDAALSYADRLLTVDPHSLPAWNVVLQVRDGVEVPAVLRDTPEVLCTLSFVSLRASRYEEAIEYARRALEHAFAADRAVLLAQALYARAFDSPLPSQYKHDLEEVKELAGRVEAALRIDQEPGLLERALLIRGQAARLLGDAIEAHAAFDRAHKVAPESPRSVYMLGLSYLEANKPEAALFLLDRTPGLQQHPLIAVMRARALLEAGRKEEALEALQLASAANVGSARSLDVEHMIIELALEAGFSALAESRLAHLKETSGWLWFLFQARLAVQRSDSEAAKAAFRDAIAGADEGSRPLVQAELAEYLRREGDPRGAVEVLADADAEGSATLRPLYARALVQAGHYATAAALLERVRGETPSLPAWALRTGANIALVREDLPQAIRYLEALREIRPTESDVGLRLALVLVQHREGAHAVEILDQLVAEDLTSRELVTAAELYIRAGRPENALPLAYRALRIEPDSADIQLAYINIFVRRENEQLDLDADIVSPNTAVVLTVDGEPDKEYFIVDQDSTGRQPGELAPSDPFAKQLLGKRRGDRVPLRPGALTERGASIKDIKSHYVHAFQSILTNFPDRHPDNVHLQAFRIPENPSLHDLQPFADIAAKRQEQVAKALDTYAANWLPLGVIASGTRTSLAHVYWLVASQGKHPLLVELSDSYPAARKAAAAASVVVITRTALITIQHLDLFAIVGNLGWKIVVPQSLLDELDEERREIAGHTSEGRLSIESSDQGPVPQSIPADTFRRELQRFDAMRAWVDAHCSVEPRPLSSLRPEDDEMRDAIGKSSFDSIALTKEMSATLYVDDSGLRRLLANGASDGFSTFALAGALLQRGVIDQERHDQIVSQLQLLNHQNLVLTPRACRLALEKLDYTPRGPVLRFFERLRDPDLSPQQVVVFCVGLLREVATSPNALDHLPALTLALTDVAIGSRPLELVVQLMRVAVETALALLPNEKDAVLGCISRVAEARRRIGAN
jgi:tetratricopeptide (TPR) repeat protein